MKIIKKVSKLLYWGGFITITSILQPAYAEVLTASILITPSKVMPDCHTYTGCGVTVIQPIKRKYIYRRCNPRHYYLKHPCDYRFSRHVLYRIY